MTAPTLTLMLAGNPAVEVFFESLHPDATRIRVYRRSEDRTWLVRGGVDIVPGVAVIDSEIPFWVPATYYAEQFDADGIPLGETEMAEITLRINFAVVHSPLEPELFIRVPMSRFLLGSLPSLVRPTPGEKVHTEGATVPKRLGGRRHAVEGAQFRIMTESYQDADLLQAMLGTYEVHRTSVLCVRTPPPMRLPRTFFAGVDELVEGSGDVPHGGTSLIFDFTADEVAPPHPGLVVPLLTYDDIDAAGDYDVQDALWPSYTARDRAYELLGLA